MASQAQLRILKEITGLQNSSDLSLAVSFREDDVRHCRALIVGPPETPYEFCFFEFDVVFGQEYPSSPPTVRAATTNHGNTRFNPNIYADGKVCLSILGTWRGESGEQWSSAQGLESILISIQSLMSANPYENEPGYESCKDESQKAEARDYVLKIRHESLRCAVLEPLEQALGIDPLKGANASHALGADKLNPEDVANEEDDNDLARLKPFVDLKKRRFMWYYDSYMAAIKAALASSSPQEGARFRQMPFEHSGNVMSGSFSYTSLQKRFEEVHAQLLKETDNMAGQGLTCLRNESPVAFGFQNRLRHLKTALSRSDSNVELASLDGNPLKWQLTLFGRPSTLLEGGIFNIVIVIPTDFPDRMPRVRVETKLFHQRVAPDGTLCYTSPQANDIDSHISAIIAAVQEESPPYDPRMLVNLKASKLLWGTDADKKTYRREMRRSAERSTE